MSNFENIKFNGTFRDYQQRVLDKSSLYLVDGKINIVAAPGSGKTILGLELIRRLNEPCIVLSPTTTIRQQWGERFRDSFLEDKSEISKYVNYDLNNICLINSITYQALYSAINKIKVFNEEEEVDYSNIDLFKIMHDNGIKTICLDEAHHLQNEWQKALEKFVKGLDKNVKIISLTATPPYDAKPNEWKRYIDLCGEIDEEIFVPELVKQNTLCPHQDYIYFNYPTEREINDFQAYRNRSYDAIDKIGQLAFIKGLSESINVNYKNILMDIYANAKEYIALMILFDYYEYEVNDKLVKLLTDVKYLPKFNLHYGEVAFQFLLNAELLNNQQKDQLIKLLKEYSVYDKNQVDLDLNDKLKRKILSSMGKIASIVQIVRSESNNLKQKLRMLILTDYIKKESIANIGTDKQFDNISVVSIFETLRRNFDINMAILSGSLVILSDSCFEYLNKYFGGTFTRQHLENINYAIYYFKGSNKEKVSTVSRLFELGLINIMIGTKSLLGEGWDSPCINSLILASFVGSFMLSNQMRGRAIRIDKNNPDKVSNIWHLATVEPEYILESNKIKKLDLYLNKSNNIIQSYDYETLTRRFDCFVGPSYEKAEIESGIERLSIIKPPFDKGGIEQINQQMLNISSDRQLLKEKWNGALERSAQINIETVIPGDRKIPAFTFINVGKIMLILLYESILISGITQVLLRFVQRTDITIILLIIFIILTFMMIYLLGRVTKKLIAHANPTNTIRTFAKCILKTLKDLDIIESACSIKVKSDDDGMFIHIALQNATIYEQNIFNSAITEFLTPINNPRYIIIKKGIGNSYNYKYSFTCPSIIGKHKESAELFKHYLEKLTGKFDLVYTRNDDGRAFLLKCRMKSYITYNAKQINKRHKVSRWE